MKTFEDLEFKPSLFSHGGIRARLDFDNGYGVSVIQNKYSYGGELGLYEVAVLLDGEITYDTPITNDVIGYQDPADVSTVMHLVQQLGILLAISDCLPEEEEEENEIEATIKFKKKEITNY